MRELWIWMGDRRVGTLDGSDRRSPAVIYAADWIDDPQATPLSTSMPVAGGAHSGRHVAAWLWGLLPDNERVLERWASRYQCSATDVVGLLEHVGSDVAGAAQFLPAGHRPTDKSTLDRNVSEDDIAEMLRALRADATAWHPEMGGRWSLAGAQAKLALAFDDQAQQWTLPNGPSPTTHIIKPAISGLDHHDLNEHLSLRTAARLGLRTARSEVRHFGSEAALVVRRYDRAVVEGRMVRVHQEDLCQALGVFPTSKYQADGGPGVEDMAQALKHVSVADPIDSIARLVRGVMFNWLILGTDAHAKNYSLLLSGSQVRLAPFYDLASAVTFDEQPRKLRLAQKIGGEYRPTVVGSRHLKRLATAVGLKAERVVSEGREMARRLPDELATVIAGEDLSGDDAVFAAKLLDRIGSWCLDCVSALH